MTDYSAFQRGPSNEQLSALSALVRALRDAEIEVERAEAALKQRAEVVKEISERQLPELMAAVGMKEFTTNDGLSVKIDRKYSAAPRVEDRDAAYNWLEEHGHGGMVKRSVEVGFGINQGEDAAALVGELRGKFADVRTGRKVEPATMSAWAKRMMEDGVAFPHELFNARTFDRAKVKTS